MAAIVGGIVVIGFAQAMPAVTMSGAMVRAMMAAYRRTLQKTMAQARSMDQVVAEAGLDWLDTPDQAVVWGTALGLQSEIEGVLSRSLEDVQQGRATGAVPYFPIWYQNSSGASLMGSRSGRGERRQPLLGLGDPRYRRDDVDPRDDRQLAVVVRRRGRRRVRRWLVGRRWRRGRRRLLGSVRLGRPTRRRTCRGSRPGPSIARGGRGRERQPSAVIRNFWVTRATPSGARLPEPVLLVAERPRHAVRGAVVEEGRGLRDERVEPVEGEPEHRRAHLLAEAAALVLAPEP